MKYLSLLLVVLFAFYFTSCGEKTEEIKQAGEVIQKAPEFANQMEKSVKEAEEIRNARKSKGDTLAMPHEKLQTFLPKEINGYKAEEPSGETVDMQGLSYSNASIKFTKPNQEGGEDFIEISILDYNSVSSMFASAVYWLNGIKKEDGNSLEMTYDPGIKYCYAYEKFYKKDKEVEISIAVAYRFLITIKANNQTSSEQAKNISNLIKIQELAKF